MDLGFFYFDPNAIVAFLARPTLSVLTDLMACGGWLIFVYMLLRAGIFVLEGYKGLCYMNNWKWVLLAIDIPPLNVQTPMAVEQMFNHLSGSFEAPNLSERFRTGYKQRWFSFEIISIEGYIQFLVRTEDSLRDLVEASVYAQYPDAEITEVEDYTTGLPTSFPNKEYDIWAADFVLSEHHGFPLRTYREFEHSISKDTVLKDPMGTFLESFSRLGPGEQMWFQMIVEPTDNSWKESVIAKVKDIIGEAKKSTSNIVHTVLDSPIKLLEAVGDQVFSREALPVKKKDEKPAEPNKIRYLTPGQSKLVESMEDKINKVGFKTKLRGIYLARKEVFKQDRGVAALIGAISQFNRPNANSLEPALRTDYIAYFFKEWRTNFHKTIMMGAYKRRKIKTGKNPFILNIEELATIWHFPMSHVKTPLVQKAEGKRAEPPASLPVETVLAPVVGVSKDEKTEDKLAVGYQTDSGAITDDNGLKFG